jgi:hypothetical protein
MAETMLYPTVKRFLEAAGFHVKGEVNGCDVVAVRDCDPPYLTVVEIRRGLSLQHAFETSDLHRVSYHR